MKSYLSFLLILCTLPLTSCFEIMEEVNMRGVGNGHYIVTVNMSQSKFQLDKILAQDTMFGVKIPNKKEIDQTFTNVQSQVKSVQGVSNVILTKDFINYIFRLELDFASTKALNAAINKVWRTYDRRADTSTVHYTASKGTFKKLSNDQHLKKYRDQMTLRDREMLSTSSYTAIYRFMNEVRTSSNVNSTISKNKKAVMFKSSLLDVVMGRRAVANEITLITP